MAVAVKSISSVKGNNMNMTIPSSTEVGDLIVYIASSLSTVPTGPSGVSWYTFASHSTTSTYTAYVQGYYAVANSSDIGRTISTNGMSSSYSAAFLMILSGASPTPFHNVTDAVLGPGHTYAESASYTTTVKTSRFIFAAEMANTSSPIPTLTPPPGHTEVKSHPAAAYFNAYVWKANVDSTAGTFGPYRTNTNSAGALTALSFDIEIGNEPPTASNLSPNSYEGLGAVDQTSTFIWTYSDTESNTQDRYEISYREVGTTGAYTTFTSANAVSTTSHTFAANTFVDGKEYEWRLRLDDALGGGWSPYYTDYFTAGKNKWSQNLPKATSTQSGVLIENNFPYGTFENATDVNVWKNNNFFGTYADTTSYSISTTRANSGTSSLQVVFPTNATQQSRIVADKFMGFKVGQRYLLQAEVFVETGGPDVKIDAFLQDEYLADRITAKNQWVTANCTFTAKEDGVFFALVTWDYSTAGTVYLDNVRVFPLPNVLEAGDYELQVKTADVEGFGPWSTTSTFTVKPPTNVYTFSGGAPVQSLNYVRVNGAWVQAAPTKRKTGGVFQ